MLLKSFLRFASGLAAMAVSAAYAGPFTSATVTRVENQVSIGSHAGGNDHPAAVHDVVQAESYLLTGNNSRAELQFADRSIVRVGQNTSFSFDAASRTLSLQKGAMLVYVPPGSGGGNIKTPSLAAAITGSVIKVSTDLMAVLSGELKTPWGIVHAGQAIAYIHGHIRIFEFDPSQAMAGYLIAWGGPLPELPVVGGEDNPIYEYFDLQGIDTLSNVQVGSRFHHMFRNPPPPPRDNEPTPPKPQPTTIIGILARHP